MPITKNKKLLIQFEYIFFLQKSLINNKKLAGYPVSGYPVAGYPAKSVSGTSLVSLFTSARL